MSETLSQRLERLRKSIPCKNAQAVYSENIEDTHSKTVIIDVRERHEYDDGFIENALQIPFGFLELEIESHVSERSTPIVLYCASGRRSLIAASHLRALGFTAVSSLEGGLNAWKDQGLPLAILPFSQEWIHKRYARHLNLPEVRMSGQLALFKKRVLVVGGGGIGNPALLYLCAAGIGTLGIVDDDVVDESNLQRQVLFTEKDVGLKKIEVLERELKARSSRVEIKTYPEKLTEKNAKAFIAGYDLVIDATDNFAAREVINTACFLTGVPFVHGSIFRFQIQLALFAPGQGASPCYRCLFPELPSDEFAPSCNEAGVIGVVPGLVGVLAASEAIKYLLKIGRSSVGQLSAINLSDLTLAQLPIEKNEACRVCGRL